MSMVTEKSSNYLVNLGCCYNEKNTNDKKLYKIRVPSLSNKEVYQKLVSNSIVDVTDKVKQVTSEAFKVQDEDPVKFKKLLESKEYEGACHTTSSSKTFIFWKVKNLEEVLQKHIISNVDEKISSLNEKETLFFNFVMDTVIDDLRSKHFLTFSVILGAEGIPISLCKKNEIQFINKVANLDIMKSIAYKYFAKIMKKE